MAIKLRESPDRIALPTPNPTPSPAPSPEFNIEDARGPICARDGSTAPLLDCAHSSLPSRQYEAQALETSDHSESTSQLVFINETQASIADSCSTNVKVGLISQPSSPASAAIDGGDNPITLGACTRLGEDWGDKVFAKLSARARASVQPNPEEALKILWTICHSLRNPIPQAQAVLPVYSRQKQLLLLIANSEDDEKHSLGKDLVRLLQLGAKLVSTFGNYFDISRAHRP